jgi:hypothetical protein
MAVFRRKTGLSFFLRLTYLALFKSRGTAARLTPRRIRLLMAFYGLFPLLEAVTRLGFLLDDVFSWGYRAQPITEPVFIVGTPRSGTTLLQRVLAQDRETFTCLRTWEIFFAPSITQRKLCETLAALDRRLGRPLGQRIEAWEARALGQVPMHRLGLQEPEEDDFLMLHIWASSFFILFFPFPEEIAPYAHFDEKMLPADRARIMTFYQRCIQRHLYMRGRGRRFLSKNPNFSPRIETLRKHFPDAKFIYMVRNPLAMLPSVKSWLLYQWEVFNDAPLEDGEFQDYFMDVGRYWYRYPLEHLALMPEDQYAIVKFEDLVQDVGQTVRDLYTRLKIPLTPAFDRVLQEETEKARHYRSSHQYSLEQMGFDRAQIVAQYQDVFERFDFDMG